MCGLRMRYCMLCVLTLINFYYLWDVFLYIHVYNIILEPLLYSSLFFCFQQEKQRTRVKEKLDKCVKEKLVDFCEFLNIPIKAGTKKVSVAIFILFFIVYEKLMGDPLSHKLGLQEELSVKLLEFLESPHVTTDVLLAEKEQVLFLLFLVLFYLF